MSRVPRIRFKGFEEDWEQRKHGEVFIYLRNNTLSREDLNDEDGFAQSIHYGDVLIKYGECLNVSKELLPYIDKKNIVNKFKKFYIQNGDVIIADTAEDETVGKCIEISGIVDHNIISGLHTIPLRPVNNFAHGYLGFYLNSNSYHNQLKPLMQGIKVTSISKNLLKITTLNYPSNIKEQKIIGSYFDSLNHLITLHQRKLEKLKIIKKSMLENIFPRNGEKTPKIRFSGFTKDWEQRKLGEIAERIVRKNEKLESTLPLTISAQYGLIDQNEFFDKRIASKDVRGYYLIKKGEFAYNKSTSVDAPFGAIKRLDKYKNGVLSTLYILFKIIDDTSTCSDYLVTYYSTDLWHKGIQSIAAEGARNHGLLNIAPDDFFETMISIPLNVFEQKKVGELFQILDHLITLHQLEPFQLIFKAIAYRIIDYAKSKPPRCRKYTGLIEFIKYHI